MSKKADIIIEVRGGVVTGIVSDRLLNRVVVVDHDTDGMDETTMKQFPVDEGRTEGVDAQVWDEVDVSPKYVKFAIKTLGF